MIAADESAVVDEPLFDARVMEGGKSDGSFSDPSCTDQGDWFKMFGEFDNLFDKFVTSKA